MQKHFLFPRQCKWIGLGILSIGILLTVFNDSIESSKIFSVKFQNSNALTRYLSCGKFSMNFENGGTVNLGDTSNDFILKSDGGFSLSTPKESSIDFTFTLQILLIVLGGLFVGFSREKNEDEFIASIRLRSLLLAVFINYLLIIIADLLVYGLNFMVVITYNLYTMLLIHLVIFHILLWKNSKKESANEE